MNFYGGSGGPLTVLLGLFIYAVKGALFAAYWLTVAAVMVLVLTAKGIRYLYRKHRRNRELREGAHWSIPPVQARTDELPMPPTSPVEYRDNDWS